MENISKIEEYAALQIHERALNAAEECQGRQHFDGNCGYFGGEKNFTEMKERDTIKLNLCNTHNINVFYYSNLGIKYPYDVFEDKNELLIKILKND